MLGYINVNLDVEYQAVLNHVKIQQLFGSFTEILQ